MWVGVAFATGALGLLPSTTVSSASAATEASAVPATVANHSCGPRANPGKVSRPYDLERVANGGARIALRSGYAGRTEYYWARITGGRVGDTVWLDWADTRPGQRIGSWHQCGPYRIHSGHDNHTPAVNYVVDGNHQRHFRACGHHAGVTRCTGWTPTP